MVPILDSEFLHTGSIFAARSRRPHGREFYHHHTKMRATWLLRAQQTSLLDNARRQNDVYQLICLFMCRNCPLGPSLSNVAN